MACANVEEAAAIQALLKGLGLTGPKLAFSEGSEMELSEQVARRLGVECQQWHYDFIRNMVRAAVEMADLDRRLQGPQLQRASSGSEMLRRCRQLLRGGTFLWVAVEYWCCRPGGH